MAKFRKKPVIVDVTQWFKNGDHPGDQTQESRFEGKIVRTEGKVVRYYRDPEDISTRECEKCGVVMHLHGWIDTLEGGHIVCPSDWIITGIQGEYYPCKDAIFRATYDPVEKHVLWPGEMAVFDSEGRYCPHKYEEAEFKAAYEPVEHKGPESDGQES